MEPYLNRDSGVAKTQSGCGSSRSNLYQPTTATMPVSATSMSRTSLNVLQAPGFVAATVLLSSIARRLKRFQILHHRHLLLRGELGPITGAFMASVRIAGDAGLELEISSPLLLRDVGDE